MFCFHEERCHFYRCKISPTQPHTPVNPHIAKSNTVHSNNQSYSSIIGCASIFVVADIPSGHYSSFLFSGTCTLSSLQPLYGNSVAFAVASLVNIHWPFRIRSGNQRIHPTSCPMRLTSSVQPSYANFLAFIVSSPLVNKKQPLSLSLPPFKEEEKRIILHWTSLAFLCYPS